MTLLFGARVEIPSNGLSCGLGVMNPDDTFVLYKEDDDNY
jgi:hypothetical protein